MQRRASETFGSSRGTEFRRSYDASFAWNTPGLKICINDDPKLVFERAVLSCEAAALVDDPSKTKITLTFDDKSCWERVLAHNDTFTMWIFKQAPNWKEPTTPFRAIYGPAVHSYVLSR